ncbi:MAG: DNA repair protein RadC [Balneolales bacterium]
MQNKVKLVQTAYQEQNVIKNAGTDILNSTDKKSNRINKRAIKNLSTDEQPQEKMQALGATSLSDAELLAILLRTGTKEMNVLETSRTLLDNFGGLRPMARKSWEELKVIKGIGKVKGITLEAVFEIARRLQIASADEKIVLKSPEAVAAYFGPKLRDLRKEVFIVVFLNAAKIMTGHRTISMGGVTATIVEPAEVMHQAIINDAHTIVVLHNHPSGNATASQSDIQLTQRLVKAGKILGVVLEDHIIIAGYDYVSLREKGLI